MATIATIGQLTPQVLPGNFGVPRPAAPFDPHLHEQVLGGRVPVEEPVRGTTYRDRPVFEWEIDWNTTPYARAEVVLHEVDSGFGDILFWRDQTHVVQGWTFSVPLSGAEIQACEQFFDDLHGRRAGFWVKVPVQAFRIVQAVSDTSFIVKDREAAENWQDQPELHVAFTKWGELDEYAKVLTVTDNGDGTETVVIEPDAERGAWTLTPDATWRCMVLAYVRLADDEERGTFEGENELYRAFRVVELPHEYGTYEYGRRPVWLYLFQTTEGGAPTEWRFTSFAWDLNDGENEWTAKRITHGALRRTTDTWQDSVEIEAEFENGSPLFQLVPPALAMPLLLTIYEADYATLGDPTVVFTGRVIGPVELEGKVVKAKAASILDVTGSDVPGMMLQPRCNYRLFEPGTCRLDRTLYEEPVTITSINGRTVIITNASLAAREANWFAEGFIEVGSGSEFERRTILQSTEASGNNITITLNAPFSFAGNGDDATVLPGCDGLPNTCITRFSNFRNFGGFRAAFRNLTIKAIEIDEIDAAKK